MRLGTLVLNVQDIERAGRFWSDALGYRFDAGDQAPVLVPPDATGVPITLDETDRTHLDLFVGDEAEQTAEMERLIALGARCVDWNYPPGADFVVLSDPEGNLFCIVISDGS